MESDKEPDEVIDESNFDEEEEDIESINFPATSPISNLSSSSGFISCSSSTSSKPNTPTNLLTIDKNYEDYDECIDTTTSSHDNNNGKTETNEIIRDNNITINSNRKHCDEQQHDESSSINLNNKLFLSTSPSSSSGIKSRCKYRSSSDHHQQSSRYRQSKKHISLDDEIVIYESDSSLIESRRRISHNSTNFNRINFQLSNNNNNGNNNSNQGRSSNAAIISRHKSEENPPTQPSNQIVSILKRKDSSGKDSPCLVTFSPNVKDNFESNRSIHRQGILKKRSSLDESSRRFRSHSPSSESEKGCLIRNNRRRNSCEEIHQGILKQKSYESTGYSSGTRSSGINTPNSVQGILKKPSLTPSEHENSTSATKHVSISEAVILAAAELCKDMIIDDSHEPYIKPILKLDNEHSSHEVRPKPILKKNHSSENEEIRSILKSRKSSREEQDDL